MSTYVIGDVHGQATLFEALLLEIGFEEGRDELYLLGDIVAGGSATLPVFRRLLETPSLYFILGNHEENFLRNGLPYLERLRELEQVTEQLLVLNDLVRDKRALPFLQVLAPELRLSMVASAPVPEGLRPYTIEEAMRLQEAVERIWRLLGERAELGEAVLRLLTCGLTGFRFRNTYQTVLPEWLRLDSVEFERLVQWLRQQPRIRRKKLGTRDLLFIHYPFWRHVDPNQPTNEAFCNLAKPELRYRQPEEEGVTEVYFGHVPTLRWKELGVIEGNPLEIASYQDARGTTYYNLDQIEGGVLTAMRLEDGARFSVQDLSLANYES